MTALTDLRADITIAVNISFTPDDLRAWAVTEGGNPPDRLVTSARLPTLLETYHASFAMSVADRAAQSAASANVTIRPRFRVTSWRAFADAPEQVQRGYDAAAEAESSIRTAIPWIGTRTD